MSGALFRHELRKTGPRFWFEMQLALLGGLITSFPVNRKRGRENLGARAMLVPATMLLVALVDEIWRSTPASDHRPKPY